jgi:hypothetical protein
MTRRRVLELTVVYPAAGLLIFAAAAVVAVPDFGGGCRLNANETAAIATLRNIAAAQEQFLTSGAVDVDADGAGEFGGFRELSGGTELRGEPGRGPLDPAVLSGAFRNPDALGVVSRSGYRFRILLPEADGQPICPDAEGVDLERIRPALSARAYLVHAWPIEHRAGQTRTFVIDPDGRVFATDHGRALGPEGPDPAAGLRPEGAASLLGGIAAESADAGGQIWTEVH